jgi:heme/copper-type cytochrome/quinol oxidase subunit 2
MSVKNNHSASEEENKSIWELLFDLWFWMVIVIAVVSVIFGVSMIAFLTQILR